MTKTKSNIWEEFANATGGKFVERDENWLSDKAEIDHNGWKIIFDNHTICSDKFQQEMTRVIAPIVTVDKFRFEIYRNGFIRSIEKIFGAQDIKIGRQEFDKTFIIKSNNEFKIKSLLQNQKIRSLIENEKEVNLELSDQKGVWGVKLPEKELELQFYTDGAINNIEHLKSLLSLFQELLDTLYQMKSIENKKKQC
ncbi:hypothetical protein NAT51_19090 [Flavobacterium amniphilum]|uniref:hypothetical protein n=1 Tax=Flavobacterium amniphilum TaxID=1834035 RepID=UPI00202AA8A3|nr:hypothetical protein [Flavobacterium amniphilum]MCL9807636.1 hypothetical protein [Flavobacterium amniphilum]